MHKLRNTISWITPSILLPKKCYNVVMFKQPYFDKQDHLLPKLSFSLLLRLLQEFQSVSSCKVYFHKSVLLINYSTPALTNLPLSFVTSSGFKSPHIYRNGSCFRFEILSSSMRSHFGIWSEVLRISFVVCRVSSWHVTSTPSPLQLPNWGRFA